MNLINRAALIVIPKRPYLDWANTLDDDGPKLDIDAPQLDFRTFNKWFEVKVSSMVIDLSRRPIALEEFDD